LVLLLSLESAGSLGGKLDGIDGVSVWHRINYYSPLGRDSVAKHCAIS